MAIRLALVGNPNSGKTTMFNALTGEVQYVGNWPGVTVDKKEGRMKSDPSVTLADLPGVYSLSPYTPEEIVTRDYLVEERPNGIINLVDGTNIERNLYLTTQCLEIGIPVIIALNMMDMVKRSGDLIDTARLAEELGCEVVETSALKNDGLPKLMQRATRVAEKNREVTRFCVFGEETERALATIVDAAAPFLPPHLQRWYSVKLFERDMAAAARVPLPADVAQRVEAAIRHCEQIHDDDSESIIANERYDFVTAIAARCLVRKNPGNTTSNRIDSIVTNRVLALPIFAAFMFGVYYIAISSVGDWTIGWMENLFGWLGGVVGGWLASASAPDWLSGLLLDGIIGGVGSVLTFVPQLMILFLLLAILEDVGYMARVAFIMDKIFRRFGLSGKSFIPMLISSGCGVPGIMATRTIENEKDRRMTAITTTFIPCGAKLPIIALIGGGMFGGEWWIAPLMYFTGIIMVVVSGIILKKTRFFAGKTAPFVMELPQYHLPDVRTVLMHVWERGRSFVVRAGTVILAACAVIWFLQSFGFGDGGFGMVEPDRSILATIGGMMSPLFAPLGFGRWEATVAAVTGLVAKEQIVGTLGVLAQAEDAAAITATLFGSSLAGMSYLLFNLICAPCMAAVGAVRRELGGRWAVIAVVYQTGLAYLVSLMVYQFGLAAGGAAVSAGLIAAICVAGMILYMLFRRGHGQKLTTG